jgi:hypothetical protein
MPVLSIALCLPRGFSNSIFYIIVPFEVKNNYKKVKNVHFYVDEWLKTTIMKLNITTQEDKNHDE